MPQTMFEKIWDAHMVHEEPGESALIYVDLHLVHEVTSPQAFEGLRLAGRHIRRPDLTVATVDHNVPTYDRSLPIIGPHFPEADPGLAAERQGVRRHLLRHG